MPIFDYQCEACGHVFDTLQKLGAEALTDCPECSKPALKKLLSAPAFHLKGKGWRNSDDTPKKPFTGPKFAHTFDSATPHGEHTHEASHDHGSSKQDASKADPGKPKEVKKSGHSHDKGHSHDHGHSHGHSNGHSHGHKHDH